MTVDADLEVPPLRAASDQLGARVEAEPELPTARLVASDKLVEPVDPPRQGENRRHGFTFHRQLLHGRTRRILRQRVPAT